MDRGLVTLIGMSIAYVASFLGMGLAWVAWRRKRKAEEEAEAEADGLGAARGAEGRE